MRATLTGKLVALWNRLRHGGLAVVRSRALTYDNARLCQALILSGRWMPHPEALEIGLKSLRWLASIQTTQAGCFRPIGSNGFYQRGGARADFDQQPVEAQAMVSACLEAFRATGDRGLGRRGEARLRVVPRPQRSRACRSTTSPPAAAATACTPTA